MAHPPTRGPVQIKQAPIPLSHSEVMFRIWPAADVSPGSEAGLLPPVQHPGHFNTLL